MKPVLNKQILTEKLWSDEFKNLDGWVQNDLVERARHRTGNEFLQPDGTIDLEQPWHKLPGRWAALYNDYREQCQFIRDGNLVMKGHVVNEPNPYRDNFLDHMGALHAYGDNRLYTSWLTSIHDIGPGTVLEVRVNLEAMQMRGHRWNFWLMPKIGNAYDSDPSHAEIDAPEVENPSRVDTDFGQRAMLKVLGGLSGDSPGGNINMLTDHGIDLRKGWHTFTTVWNLDGTIEFNVDGIECARHDGSLTMTAELIMAREMNSGVKEKNGKDWENRTTGPKVPADPGLTGQSVILDIDMMEDDEVIVSRVTAWKILTGKIDEPVDPPVDGDELAKIIEDYEHRLGEQRQQINALTLERDDLRINEAKVTDAVHTLLKL